MSLSFSMSCHSFLICKMAPFQSSCEDSGLSPWSTEHAWNVLLLERLAWTFSSAWGTVSMAGGVGPAFPLLGLSLGWMVWRSCYLAVAGGGQAALLPEAEGALQLL